MDSLVERVVRHRVGMSSLSVVSLLRHRHTHVDFRMVTFVLTDMSPVTLFVNKGRLMTVRLAESHACVQFTNGCESHRFDVIIKRPRGCSCQAGCQRMPVLYSLDTVLPPSPSSFVHIWPQSLIIVIFVFLLKQKYNDIESDKKCSCLVLLISLLSCN